MLDVSSVLRELREVGYTDATSIHAEYSCHFYWVEKDIEATNKLVAKDVAYLRELI
jgi:sugar phosphate isomerase/epimerase